MFGFSLPEIFVILVVALLVIGPDKLPEVARGMGKGMRQLQRLINEVRDSVRLDEPYPSHTPPPTPPPVPTFPPAPATPPATSSPPTAGNSPGPDGNNPS